VNRVTDEARTRKSVAPRKIQPGDGEHRDTDEIEKMGRPGNRPKDAEAREQDVLVELATAVGAAVLSRPSPVTIFQSACSPPPGDTSSTMSRRSRRSPS